MQYLVYSVGETPDTAAAPTPELMVEMGKLVEEGRKAGVLVATGALAQTGKRLKRQGGKFSLTDGPFIEAKELLGGWAIIQVKTLDEAVEWSKRFRNIVGDGESEIVQIFGPDDFAGA